ncbi:MAG TPA: carbohydrate ABC transporter permease [Thermoleophilia bacterium]|nr:carbohydrate ABC transporter permease [Thermoleophilia bacterium]
MAAVAHQAEHVAPLRVAEKRKSVAHRLTRVLSRAPLNILLLIIGVFWLVPTLGLFFTSLIVPDQISSVGWWKIFAQPSLATLENYRHVFADRSIMSALVITVFIAIGATVLPLLVGALAAYAFAWIDFPGRDWLFVGVVAAIVVPYQMALIPIFSIYNHVGLFDTVLGIVLFHTGFGLPFAIFLLRNFFVGIPKELLEAARIDGAGELRIFMRLVLPLGMPALASLTIFQFLWTWNDLLVALTFGRDTQPITVAIFTQMRQFGSNIDLIAPASFLSLAIPLVVFFAFQRYFAQGLLAGSVKS